MVLATNLTRVRTAQRISFAELSRLLGDIGRPIPELGLRRIERGERRVDFDDLLALCYVLRIAPVDLMVSKDVTDAPYPVIPTHNFTANSVREWIRGETVRLEAHDPEVHRHDLDTVMTEILDWMLDDRRRRVGRDFYSAGDED